MNECTKKKHFFCVLILTLLLLLLLILRFGLKIVYWLLILLSFYLVFDGDFWLKNGVFDEIALFVWLVDVSMQEKPSDNVIQRLDSIVCHRYSYHSLNICMWMSRTRSRYYCIGSKDAWFLLLFIQYKKRAGDRMGEKKKL